MTTTEQKNIEVNVTTISGEPLATLKMEPGANVSKVKEHFEEHFGYPTASQQCLREGTIAEDSQSLQDFPQPVAFTLVLAAFNKAEALHDAAERGHEAAVTKLLFHVAIDRQETTEMLAAAHTQHGGRSALHAAALRGHAAVCQALCEAERASEGVSLAVREETVAALHDAASNGHETICQELLEAAPINKARREMLSAKQPGGGGDAALHLAARQGHGAACRALLAGAPFLEVRKEMLLAKGSADSTALHHAASEGSEAACRALLEVAEHMEVRSEMLAATDEGGRTAAEVAAEGCRSLFE